MAKRTKFTGRLVASRSLCLVISALVCSPVGEVSVAAGAPKVKCTVALNSTYTRVGISAFQCTFVKKQWAWRLVRSIPSAARVISPVTGKIFSTGEKSPVSSPAPTPTTNSTSSAQATPTPGRSTAENLPLTPASLSANDCKLQTKPAVDWSQQPWWFESKLGFPKAPNRIKSVGVVKAIMIFVSFDEVAPSGNPTEESLAITTDFQKYISEVSYGKLSFDITVPNEYFSIPRTSASFGMTTWMQGDARGYLEAGIKAADSKIDFSPYDVIYVIPPSSIKDIVYGPAFPESGSFAEIVDGKKFTSEAVAGADARNPAVMLSPWVWMAHETGHLLGMIHPYVNPPALAPYWDLMFWDVGGPGFYGWTRFEQGWIEDSQVVCSKLGSNFTSLIAPLDARSVDSHLAVIPESKTQAIVIENRRASQFDKLNADQEGLVVYEIFLDQPNEQVKLVETPVTIDGRQTGMIRPGERVTINGVTIVNKGSYLQGDVVEVTSN